MRVFAAREQVVGRLRAVADHLQAVGHVGLGEGDAGQFDVVRVVLDQQDVFLAHARFPESGTAGSSTKKVLPAPGSDCAQTRPPWRSATQRTMARPRPLPPACSGPCRRWNGSNNLSAYRMSNPLPWSRTSLPMRSPWRPPSTSPCPRRRSPELVG